MGLIIAIFGGLSLLASILAIAACMLSARISHHHDQAEQHATTLDLPSIPVIEATR